MNHGIHFDQEALHISNTVNILSFFKNTLSSPALYELQHPTRGKSGTSSARWRRHIGNDYDVWTVFTADILKTFFTFAGVLQCRLGRLQPWRFYVASHVERQCTYAMCAMIEALLEYKGNFSKHSSHTSCTNSGRYINCVDWDDVFCSVLTKRVILHHVLRDI